MKQPDREKSIEERAVEAFKDHVVEVLLEQGMYRHYRCGKPHDGNMHFHILTAPWRLFVYGDIGDMAWERSEDMLAWARGAVHSIGYFEEKCWNTLKTKEYSAERAALSVLWEYEYRSKDLDASEQDLLPAITEVRDRLLSLVETEHEFMEAYMDSDWYDGEFPDVEDYSHNFLWAREAVRWFLNNHKPPVKE